MTDLSVYMELHDIGGASSGEYRLEAIDSQSNPFESGTVSHCEVKN